MAQFCSNRCHTLTRLKPPCFLRAFSVLLSVYCKFRPAFVPLFGPFHPCRPVPFSPYFCRTFAVQKLAFLPFSVPQSDTPTRALSVSEMSEMSELVQFKTCHLIMLG